MTVSDDLQEIKRQTEREVDVLRDHIVAKMNIAVSHIENTVELYRRERETVEVHHNELHALEQKNLEEFKTYVREQLTNILHGLDAIRTDRGNFISRDAFDTSVDALEKANRTVEKTIIEKNDLAVSQLEEKHDASISQLSESLSAKITALGDRITKMEQGIQVMNARNQQSILALGALLTAVEIIIRFFTR